MAQAQTQTQPTQTPTVDYDALAQQAGAINSTPPAKPAPKKGWVPQAGDSVAHIQTSDGQPWHIHEDDLSEAQRRDPNLKVIAPPAPYQPDYDALAKQAGAIDASTHPPQASGDEWREETLMNMTRAMAGQPAWGKTPQRQAENQRQFEEGKKAGTIAGATQIGLSVLGPALGFLGIGAEAAPEAKQIGTGLYDEFGKEIFKEAEPAAKQAAWKVIQHPIVQKAIKRVVKGVIGEEVGRRLGDKIGGTPGSVLGGIGGAYLSDKVLNWLLSD